MKPLVAVLIAGVVFVALAQASDPVGGESRAIVSHIKHESVRSSGLASVGYSKKLHALEIEFVNGAIYRYLNVPPSVYAELQRADSKARFYHQNIRGKYWSIHVRPRKKE